MAFENLKDHVKKLNSLLNKQEVGLFTWCEAVSNEWGAIAELQPFKSQQCGQKAVFLNKDEISRIIINLQCGQECYIEGSDAYVKV